MTSDFERLLPTADPAVLRVHKTNERVYLKGSNREEGRVTTMIPDFASPVVRKLILVNEREEWMLMNDDGEGLFDRLSRSDCEVVSILLAEVQIDSLQHIEQLKAGGVSYT